MLLRFDPFRDLDRAFDDVWRTTGGGGHAPIIPMDAVRHGDRVFISFDLPGVDPDRVDLTVERNVLTVTAERSAGVQEGDQVLADERPKGAFARRVLLGDTLDTGKLEAAYDHGVLTVTIPVAEQAQPRKISIGGHAEPRAIHAESVEA